MLRKVLAVLRSVLDPRPFLFLFRLVHFYNYDRVAPAREATIGKDVGLPPTVSLRNGARLTIGDRCRIGSFSALWAGERASITIGEDTLFGPRVFVTVANYGLEPGTPPMHQVKTEADVVIGAGCWFGTGVTVLPGVTIGDGAVIGAGAVVAKDVPANAIVVGTAARVLRER